MSQNKLLIGASAVIILVLIAIFVAANVTTTADNDSEQVVIGATIFPLVDITEQIGGDKIQVVSIVPPGASPHSYSITPQQIAELTNAQLIFKIGHNLDDNIAQTIAKTHGLPTVTVDNNIDLLTFGNHGHEEEHENADLHEEEPADEHEDHNHDNGDINPHYWLDVHNAEQIATNIADYLAEIDPDNADTYSANLARYLGELAILDAELQEMADNSDKKEFIAMHDAWLYFANRYGFKQVASYEPVEGKQPSATDLNEIKEVINEHNISVFYSEPQKVSSAAIRFLEKEFSLKIAVMDPVGGLVENDSYIKMMKRNMEALINP